jgi:hypothetical protein
MNPNIKFNELVKKAVKGFDQKKLLLGFSLCATPINLGKPVIMGINWGGGSSADNISYESKLTMPTIEEFKVDYKEGYYPFLNRSQNLIKNYLKISVEEAEFNYTNLCLFRSPNISSLTSADFKEGIPLLKDFVGWIQPPSILSLGNSNMRYLKKEMNGSCETVKLKGKGQVGYRGVLWGCNFYCVPHPIAWNLNEEQRNEIWQAVFLG